MMRWRNVLRAAPVAALLAGVGAPVFGHPPFEPRVEGIPFRAVSMVEFVTTSGGNLSSRRSSGLVARDAAGRTRREGAMGPEGAHVIAIHDPVASVHYLLFPDRGTGRKLDMAGGGRERRPGPGRPGPMGRRFSGPGGSEGKPTVRTESLGTQVIAGVEAEGTRDTIAVAAGVHGNEAPFEIVSERWFAPELKTVVRHLHRDPRGERTWTLVEITREEPEAALFEAPDDIEIEEGVR